MLITNIRIEFYDIIPEFEYEVCEAIRLLSDAEKEKLKKYIIRLTNGRAVFSKKRKGSVDALRKVDENCREIYER